jgi:DNA-binding CsgD family transcriptional regulator
LDVIKSAVACSTAASGEEIICALEITAEALGFEYYSVFEAKAADDRVVLTPILGKTHDAWLAHYREASLSRWDLRLRRARLTSRDFFCSEVLREDPTVTPEEFEFFVTARKYGIGDSYVLPYRTAGGRVFASVFIGEGRPITSELRVQLRTLAHELLLSSLKVVAQPQVRVGNGSKALTARQHECLSMIRDGLSSSEIARLLNISARTVDHYVGGACARLGVRSRAQAVALAISLNIVPPQTLG